MYTSATYLTPPEVSRILFRKTFNCTEPSILQNDRRALSGLEDLAHLSLTMVSRRSLWAAISVLVGRSASSHVQNGVVSSVISRDPTGPPAWVTVNSDGGATTMTPIVATTDGTASTISAAPSELTQTAAWTLTISGATTTSTGINPVATASGPGEEGAFLLCDNYQGEHAPICQPEDGSALDPGAVYYGTLQCEHPLWDNLLTFLPSDMEFDVL